MDSLTTPGGTALAEGVAGDPAGTVLAQVAMFYEDRPQGRPGLRAVLNIKVHGDTHDEKTDAITAIAAWLGVEVDERNGTLFAQREWTDAGGSLIILEAHYTPDQDKAYAEWLQIRQAQAAAGTGAR